MTTPATTRRLLGRIAGFAWTAATVAIALATVAATLLLVDQQLLASTGAFRLVAWWWLRFLAFYLPVGVAVAAIAAGARRGPRLLHAALAAVGGLALVALLAANHVLLRAVLDAGPATGTLLAASLVVAVAAALATFATGRRAVLLRGVAATLAAGLLAAGVAPRRAAPPVPPPAERVAAIAAAPSDRLLVVGLDGADWSYIDALGREGLLPNLTRLRDEGVWGTLKTIRPTSSPLLWTTVVTGKRPEEHGVLRITVFRPKGLNIGVQGRRIRVRALGVETLRRLLRRSGQLVQSPITGAERRVPAIWNIGSAFSRPLSVSSWWATWPAERILGRMVSDRVFYDRAWAQGATDAPDRYLTFPEELTPRMRRLAIHPGDVDDEAWRRFLDVTDEELRSYRQLAYSHHDVRSEFPLYYAMFESDRRFVRELMRQDEAAGRAPGDLLVLYRFLDQMSHCCLRYSPLAGDHLAASAEDLRRFGRATGEAYRALDAEVGELVARFGDANVVLLSDHGFTLETRPEQESRYAHTTAPDGIFLAVGPAFRRGEARGLSLYDVMPLLLYLKGLPVAADLVRPLRTDLIREEYLAEHPPAAIDSYDFVPVVRGEAPPSRSDERILEELRALGYIG